MTELEKAAREYADGFEEIDPGQDDNIQSARIVGFKRGAEWQAKQSPWISVQEQLPNPGKLVNVRCRNKNKEDGIWLYDVCFIAEDTNTWGERHHTWETITHWIPILE